MKTDLALKLLEGGNPHRALPILHKRLAKYRRYQDHIHYASALRGCGRIMEAIDTLENARGMNQERPEVWNNLGQCFEDLGFFDRAPSMYQRALECVSKTSIPVGSARDILLSFAYSMMRLGQFEYIWPIWEESRFNITWHSFPSLIRWRGEPGKNLLILPEGGYGDAVLFSRWIPHVAAISNSVSVMVWDRIAEYLAHVLRSSAPAVKVICLSKEWQYDDLAQFTHCIPMMSLPSFCGIRSWSDVPAQINWDPPECVISPPLDWIGFCWSAEENGMVRKFRSLDDQSASVIGKFLATRAERVVSLYLPGKNLYRKDKAKIPKGVIQDDVLIDGWEPTARTLLKCKYVVTVDTAVAHLSASLGIRTLLLLPLRSDWKWGLDATRDAVWYGQHLHIFRNSDPVTWDTEQICKVLESF